VRCKEIARVVIVAGLSLIACGCSWHRHRTAAAACPNPAKIVGVDDGGGFQGGWVLIRNDLIADDVATRIAATYHVRTQALAYVHGFSTFPVPEASKFLCDKAVVEVHYDPPRPDIVAR